MASIWQLRVYDSERLVYEADLTGAADIGRQQNEDEKRPGDAVFRPWHSTSGSGARVIIAPLKEATVSRKHLEIKPLAEGRFQLTNSSSTQVVGLPGRVLKPRESSEVTLPAVIRLGNRTLRMQALEEESLESLPMVTMAPGSSSLDFNSMQAMLAGDPDASSMKSDQLMAWIQAFLGLLHSAAGSEDFYAQAARSLVELVKLDAGRVLFRVGDGWRVETVQAKGRLIADSRWRPSSSVMGHVLRDKKTFWQVPDSQVGASTRGIDAVVAAPILDRKGDVIGALYGERQQAGGQSQRPISKVEAALVEVLAHAVAVGLARVEQEQMALRAQLQLEQYFGKRLAVKLAAHPELLEGRGTDISVLFVDIRSFSRISEQLGPARTVEWISDVMNVLTQCVQDQEGVVVDYVGDELMAIWGAPEDQPDHAARACRAGLAMFASLASLNERWEATLKRPLMVGVGINSGNAQVGNVGSKLRLKYGAMGNTVNLASRVQGATKHLKSPMLITDSTQAAVKDTFETRRLCDVRVVNIEKPVSLYELALPDQPGWAGLKLGYEQALSEFTSANFRQACRILGRLILDNPNDGPSLKLLSRSVALLVDEPEKFDPVMVFGEK